MVWLIPAVLVGASIALIRWPFLTLDMTASAPTTAATLAGALIGAAAVFAGVQINEVIRRREGKIELEKERRRVRAVLDNEFVRICVNLMQYASELSASLHCPGQTLDFGEPPPNPIFERLGSAMLTLPENEIDALCTFYGGLDQTRREIRDQSRAFNVMRILGHVHHDLTTAEEVTRKIWPTRKVRLPEDEQPHSLADKLKERADAIAEAMSRA